MNNTTKDKNTVDVIDNLKREFVDRYILLMLIVLVIYIFVFNFLIKEDILVNYLLGGIIFLSYSYLIVRNKYPINIIVHAYLVLAPLYCTFIIIVFWESSVATLFWLVPIPIGASVFFSKKIVVRYLVYLLFLVVFVFVFANSYSLKFGQHNLSDVLFSDIVLFISNIIIISLLLYYKDLIRKQEILIKLEKLKSHEAELIEVEMERKKDTRLNNNSNNDNDIDIEVLKSLFNEIDSSMQSNLYFRDSKFNLASLSAALRINSYYISKAIHHNGFPNFTAYINSYRISYVKKLLKEEDLQKTTLMYVYTNAGFSSQSTFNRVFKQIEGITPSEYVQNNHMDFNFEATD